VLPLTATVPSDGPVTFLASTTPAPPPLSFGGKIPIPKMKRPLPSSGRGPIVLTLGSDGLYYPAASSSSLLIKAETTPALASAAAATPAAVMTANSTTTAATEPAAAASYSAFRSYCSPMVAGLPTVATPRGSEDVSVYFFISTALPLYLCPTARFLILSETQFLILPSLFPVFDPLSSLFLFRSAPSFLSILSDLLLIRSAPSFCPNS
jgi:hypothetical protein